MEMSPVHECDSVVISLKKDGVGGGREFVITKFVTVSNGGGVVLAAIYT